MSKGKEIQVGDLVARQVLPMGFAHYGLVLDLESDTNPMNKTRSAYIKWLGDSPLRDGWFWTLYLNKVIEECPRAEKK